MQNECYLLCVTADNHNKYYRMIPSADGSTFTVEYGRVEATAQTTTYPMSKWSQKYNEKIRKGYVDRSDLYKTAVKTVASSTKTKDGKTYKMIDDTDVRKLVDTLLAFADKTVADNYNINVKLVTKAMLVRAEDILDSLTQILRTTNDTNFVSVANTANNLLVSELFTVIPRKMNHVANYIIDTNTLHDSSDFITKLRRIIQRETELLDVLRTKVVQTVQQDALSADDNLADKTILEVAGLEISACTAEDIVRIKKSLGEISNRFYRAWRVTNLRTQKDFDNFKRKYRGDYKRFPTKLLWHGSGNQNWWSILNNGLKIRPNGVVLTGAMFGNGIYFAPKAKKSLGYTSLKGSYWAHGSSDRAYMALYDVAYGKPFDVDQHNSSFYTYDWDKLQRNCRGAHCLHAHAGKSLYNDEIIVYKPEQVTVRYLVELR